MSTKKILDSDWSHYDDRKKRNGSDHNNFACTEKWEVDYLVEKIREHHPHVPEADIRSAITVCCKEVPAPHLRKAFVTCVMKRLGLD
jgi:hypothetical protein